MLRGQSFPLLRGRHPGQQEGMRHQFVVVLPKEKCMERSTSLMQDVNHPANISDK